MRTKIALFLSVSAIHAFSQIAITQVDMPSAGDTMRYSTATAPGIDILTTGANVTWDMGQLTQLATGADTAVTVGSTPILYQFYFNNQILYPQHKADYAQKGPAIGAQGVQVTDVFEYFKKSADGFRNVGFGASINGLPASVRRIPIDRIYQFPMNFGDVNGSPSFFELTVPNLLYYSQQQQRDNAVDGWGTLYLPTDTFQVLRVRSVLQRHDSVYIDQFGTGFGFDQPETVEYKWLAQGMDAPVLMVTTVGGTATNARYYRDPSIDPTGITSIGTNLVSAYPNPVRDMLYVSMPSTTSLRATIIDATGKTVRSGIRSTGNTRLAIDVSELVTGVYVLRSEDNSWTVQFVVER